MNYKIIINKAKCLYCDMTVESKHVHDFVMCKCGNLSVDGGKEYLKRIYKDREGYKEMSEMKEIKSPKIKKTKNSTKIEEKIKEIVNSQEFKGEIEKFITAIYNSLNNRL